MKLTRNKKKIIKQTNKLEKAYKKICDLGGHAVVCMPDGSDLVLGFLCRGDAEHKTHCVKGRNDFYVSLI